MFFKKKHAKQICKNQYNPKWNRDRDGTGILPPLPFLVAIFAEACHDFLLQVGNGEALEGWILTQRVGRGVAAVKQLDSLPRQILRRRVG